MKIVEKLPRNNEGVKINNEQMKEWLVKSFLSGNIFNYKVFFSMDYNIYEKEETYNMCKEYVRGLLEIEICEICNSIEKFGTEMDINAKNIVQFSNIKDGTELICDILERSGNFGFTYAEIGEYLSGEGKKLGAYTKYGENHAKLATALGLAVIEKENKRYKVFLTPAGEVYNSLGKDEKEELVRRLIIRIPIIKNILMDCKYSNVNVTSYMNSLSESTMLRRKSNVVSLLDEIHGTDLIYKNCYMNIEKR